MHICVHGVGCPACWHACVHDMVEMCRGQEVWKRDHHGLKPHAPCMSYLVKRSAPVMLLCMCRGWAGLRAAGWAEHGRALQSRCSPSSGPRTGGWAPDACASCVPSVHLNCDCTIRAA